MARWSFSLGVIGLLLGACAQTPGVPVELPAASRTMSTDEDDAATQVVVDSEANAYVLGTAGSSGFLNRYRADGSLLWHTNVALPACEGCRVLELGLVENTLYALVDESDALAAGSETVRLTAFSRSGERLSRRSAKVTGTDIQEAVIGPNARSYVLSRTDGETGASWHLDAFSPQGQLRWTKTIRFPATTTTYSQSGVSLASAPDGSVYVAGVGDLQRYDADGTLSWAREFSFGDQTHLREHLAVGVDNVVYYVRDLTRGDVVPFNVEVKRFDAAGREVWTRTLVDERAVTSGHQVGAAHLTVAPSGALFVVGDEAYGGKNTPYAYFSSIYKLTSDGQVSAGEVLADGADTYDLAFSPVEEVQPDYVGMNAKVSYLFSAGSSVEAGGTCYDPETAGEGSAYCPDTDAFLAKHRFFSSNQEVSAAGELVWYRD